jgi:hypothetical protein
MAYLGSGCMISMYALAVAVVAVVAVAVQRPTII